MTSHLHLREKKHACDESCQEQKMVVSTFEVNIQLQGSPKKNVKLKPLLNGTRLFHKI